MTVHYLKIWANYYDRVSSGQKTFEVRKNDRDFQVGDELILQDYCPDTKTYSGSEVRMTVTYILPGGSFGIEPRFVVMGIKPSNF